VWSEEDRRIDHERALRRAPTARFTENDAFMGVTLLSQKPAIKVVQFLGDEELVELVKLDPSVLTLGGTPVCERAARELKDRADRA
jgi:hypothetical protein